MSPARFIILKVCDHTLLVQPESKARPIVLDCGANRGRFAEWAANTLGAHVYSFEADPTLAAELPCNDYVTVINAAIADRDGSVTLYKSDNLDASSFFGPRSSSSFQVASRSIDSFVQEKRIPAIDLIKIDIEGWELPVLETLSASVVASTKQITCEFHDFLDRGQIPRIKRIIRDFQDRGWFVVNMAIRTYGDVLFINQSLLPLTFLQRARIYIHKYASAVMRVYGRL